MKEEVLQKMRKEYLSMQKEQKELRRINNRLAQLRENPVVQEYLALSEEASDSATVHIFPFEGIRKAYSRYKMEIEDTNGIMICLGTYQTSSECDIVHGSADILVPRDSKNAEFRTYVDLEKPLSDAFNVPISLCEEYEKKHTVLFPSPLEAREFHHYLKISFLEDAFANGQETAVQNVLTKSIKN